MSITKTSQKAIVCLLIFAPCLALAQGSGTAHASSSTLEKVIVLGRHGVRSPLQTNEKLAAYSHSVWPAWDAPPGFLTSHGRALMTSLGAFYQSFYTAEGLFKGEGCDRARSTYVWSDTDERDVATAGGFVAGLFPGCDVPIHRLSGEDEVDPVVHPLKAHIGHPDKAEAAAEVLGSVGGDADNVKIAYMPAFLTLDRILGGCGKTTCDGEVAGRQMLFNMKADIEPAEDDDHLIRESKGPLGVASTLSEILLLEYADGKPMDQVGFGRLSRADLTQVLGLHSIYSELSQETDYPARVGASNMMKHIVDTLMPHPEHEQSPNTDAQGETNGFGPPGKRFVYLATHDTNIANMAGLLRIHWMMAGDQADPTPPGGALVFELRKDTKDGSQWVRLRFISETLDQMHVNAPLSLEHPATVFSVFIPGCSVASHANECPLDGFARLVHDRVLPEFTTP
jgi:4-phytase/acid phosphatase